MTSATERDGDDEHGRDRRRHPRFPVLTQISLSKGGVASELQATNISAGGIFVQLVEGAYPGVHPGSRVTVHFDLGSDNYGRPLDLTAEAEVVRVDLGGPGRPAGFALMWTSEDAAVASQLAVILEYLHG